MDLPKRASGGKFFNTSGMTLPGEEPEGGFARINPAGKIRLLAEDGMLVKRPLLIGEGFVLAGFRQGQWEEALAK